MSKKSTPKESPLSASASVDEWTDRWAIAESARKKKFESISFREQVPLATEEHGVKEDRLGKPGEFPFTRGVHASMYRGRLWTMRQFAGFGSPEDTNRRFKYLLKQGQTGLSTAFDMPTLMGYDPDHSLSRGEVGREGVNVATIEDMERLFADIDLSAVSTSMTINCSATYLMALYFAVAKRRGISLQALSGTIQNDILKEFIAQKEWISPPEPSVRLTCDIIEFCASHAKKFNPVSISGYHIREAGATAVQELAFTLADGLAYVDHCVGRGMAIDDFAPRLSFFFDVHNDFFEEIAKFRAARRMWANLLKERYGSTSLRSLKLRTHAQTAGVSLTAQQPLNNVARVALQAMAAVLGGVQSLHTNSMDETLSLPTREAVTVALRTQQIIAEETGVTNTVDPLGGSYYLEQLTDSIEAEAYAYIKKIDGLGGMLAAVNDGFPQREISEAAYEFQQRSESKEYVTVGVNGYADSDEQEIPTLHIDTAVEKDQIERMAAFKAKRDPERFDQALQRLRRTCQNQENVMPVLIDIVEDGVTLGDVCDVYREVFGVYRDPGLL